MFVEDFILDAFNIQLREEVSLPASCSHSCFTPAITPSANSPSPPGGASILALLLSLCSAAGGGQGGTGWLPPVL